ncbi:MAG: DUF2085 domain-containing protein [Caldilineaceae bacterium]|nr:DUF2085 domain-containing protein [Caldilineaceae bacterium]MBP8110297.1 DUF2085 domain-containing protein [Caldilineaceae bacterium]MBP8123973.1 DUF2085 domain-containing protein [Caldilineaceae bacterium]MBP9074032.1 DUF2085 domain-containing protein [Caldilineaceae bacterium]
MTDPTSPQNQSPPPARQADAIDAIGRGADRLVNGIARHWLLLFNLAVTVYVGLPFLAPVLMEAGATAPASVIYGMYSFACHQLPDHSYFLFADTPTPTLSTLENWGMGPGLDLFQQRKFIGSESAGYKVGLCQRDVAIYASVVLAGLLFGLFRRRLKSPSLKVYALFLIPIAVDGLSQMVGLRESNWWLRTVTGALFGMASVWLAYPYIEEAMQDVLRGQSRNQP